jgi:hypothetical protein
MMPDRIRVARRRTIRECKTVHAAMTARAWVELLRMEFVLLRGFRAVQRNITRTRIQSGSRVPVDVSEIAEAVERASVWYFKAPKCLQRSAAATRLMRRRGIPAQLVVGCHMAPMRAHAWVEVSGNVVSDGQPDLEHYMVLDRW